MRVKLEYELGYKYSHRIPMQVHNKVTIFDMVFATDHWAGDRYVPPVQPGGSKGQR